MNKESVVRFFETSGYIVVNYFEYHHVIDFMGRQIFIYDDRLYFKGNAINVKMMFNELKNEYHLYQLLSKCILMDEKNI